MDQDELQIRRLIEGWVLWRDTGDWDRLRRAWHSDGYMVTTMGPSSAADFVEAAIKAWQRGMDAQHALGGMAIEISGHRAVANTKMTLSQRAPVDQILCDAQCIGRFVDFLERRDGNWAIVLRHPIYERSRIDVVDPQATLALDSALLQKYPPGYRYLAYLQASSGAPVRRDLPGPRDEGAIRIVELGNLWLEGGPMSPIDSLSFPPLT